MADFVGFVNDQTGETKQVKVGFSWVLLFFSNAFGIPLFLRGLTGYGVAMLGLSVIGIVAAIVDPSASNRLLGVIKAMHVGAAFSFGFTGNKLTAQHLLKNGWSLAEPDSSTTIAAAQKWSLG